MQSITVELTRLYKTNWVTSSRFYQSFSNYRINYNCEITFHNSGFFKAREKILKILLSAPYSCVKN